MKHESRAAYEWYAVGVSGPVENLAAALNELTAQGREIFQVLVPPISGKHDCVILARQKNP